MRQKIRRRGTAIVDTPRGILVASDGKKAFLLPGGNVERKESRRKAAMRELKEETKLRAYDSKYLFTYNESKYYSDGRRRKIVNLHKVFLIKAKGHARPSHEIKYLAYCKNGKEVKYTINKRLKMKNENIQIKGNTKKIIEKYLKMKKEKSQIGFLKKILGI